jgi:membrane-associated phospholipid phosphatase
MMSYLFSLDMHVLQALYAVRNPELVQMGIWVSELGESYTICGLAVCVGLVLLMRRHYVYCMGLFIAVVTSGIGTFILKSAIARPRPPLSYQAYQEVWYSFPSAHASMSLAVFGFFVFLVWQFTPSRPVRMFSLLLTIALVGLLGFLRLYLGVHYLSDVAGGYVLGGLCLWLSIWSVRMYTKKA